MRLYSLCRIFPRIFARENKNNRPFDSLQLFHLPGSSLPLKSAMICFMSSTFEMGNNLTIVASKSFARRLCVWKWTNAIFPQLHGKHVPRCAGSGEKNTFHEHIELPAKLQDYFLRSTKSKINEYYEVAIFIIKFFYSHKIAVPVCSTDPELWQLSQDFAVIISAWYFKNCKVGVTNTYVACANHMRAHTYPLIADSLISYLIFKKTSVNWQRTSFGVVGGATPNFSIRS